MSYLRTNSVALNAAQNIPAVEADLDENARPFGVGPDIGWYEQQPLTLRIGSSGVGHLLQIKAGASRTYQIEASPELTNWPSLAAPLSSNHALQYVDTKMGPPCRPDSIAPRLPRPISINTSLINTRGFGRDVAMF